MNSKFIYVSSAALAMMAMTWISTLHTSQVRAQESRPKGSGNDEKVYAPMERVPAEARERPNPLGDDTDAITAGGKLYEQHCEECHGLKAEGTRRGPSLLKEPIAQASSGALFWILSNGVVRQGMPDWSKLPEPERWQIVTFLKSFKAPAVSQQTIVPR